MLYFGLAFIWCSRQIPLAKSLRHAIDPIGSFPQLLRLLDQAFAKHRPHGGLPV